MYLNSHNFEYKVDKKGECSCCLYQFSETGHIPKCLGNRMLEIEVTRYFFELFVTVTQVQTERFKVSQTFVFLSTYVTSFKKKSLSRAIMKLLRV